MSLRRSCQSMPSLGRMVNTHLLRLIFSFLPTSCRTQSPPTRHSDLYVPFFVFIFLKDALSSNSVSVDMRFNVSGGDHTARPDSLG